MMRSFKIAFVVFTILVSTSYSEAAPQAETTKPVGILGLNNQNGFVSVASPGDSTNCTFGLINFDATTPTGVILYASLLSAKTANRTVTLYYERVEGACTLTQVAVF